MSAKIEAEVWEHSAQKGNALVLLLAIAGCANDQGEAFPSEAELMQKTRTGKRGLRSLVGSVRESGELAVSGVLYQITLSAKEPEPPTLIPREPGPAEEVFDDWKAVHGHPHAKLDGKRRKTIVDRMKDGYTVDDLKRANRGCKASEYHQGKNDTHRVYDDIDLIYRDAKHVDMFIAVLSGRSATPKEQTRDEQIMQARLDGSEQVQ